MRVHPALVVLCCMGLTGAWAQVVKCTNPANGQRSYTDGQCDGGTQARHLLDKPSPEQLARQETEAERARMALAEERDLQAAMQPSPSRPYGPYVGTPSQAASCSQARSNLEAAANYKYTTPQRSAALVGQAQQRVDAACREPAPRVHVVRRVVPPPVVVRR